MLILTEKELLDRAGEGGFDIPPSRFARWRDLGLVPTIDDRPGQGRGKGRAAHSYSERALEQTIQIARMRSEKRDLDEIGWRLWLDGYNVDGRWWLNTFKVVAQQYDKCAATIRKVQESDEFIETNLDRMIAAAFKAKKTSRFMKQIRKSLGEARFRAIMDEVSRMATGVFRAISSHQTSENSIGAINVQRALDVAFGFEHARTDTIVEVGPIIKGNYTAILQETFAPLKDLSLVEFLESIDPEDLRRITKSMIDLLNSIDAASEAFDRVYARDAFGLRRVAMVARADRNIQAGAGLVWVLVQKRSSEEFHELDVMSKLFLNAAIGARKLLDASDFDLNKGRPKFQRTTLKKQLK